MSKRVVELFILDIFVAIEKIKRYTKDFSNADDFLFSEMAFDATIRELEIIGEALNNLFKNEKLNLRDEWRIIIGFRNILAHKYFGVDIEEVWDIIENHLDNFLLELINWLKEYPNKSYFFEILNDEIKENRFLNKQTIIFLKSLENRG